MASHVLVYPGDAGARVHQLLNLLADQLLALLAGQGRCIVPDLPLGSHSLPMNEGADLSAPAIARLIAEFMDRLELENMSAAIFSGVEYFACASAGNDAISASARVRAPSLMVSELSKMSSFPFTAAQRKV